MGEGSTDRIIKKSKLVGLVAESARVKAKTSEISGTYGQKVKDAVDNHHLNKKAFSIVTSLHRMEEDKRNDVLRSLAVYIDFMATGTWNTGHFGDLLDDTKGVGREDDSEEDEDEGKSDEEIQAEHVASNVHNLSGIKPLSDEPKPVKPKTGGAPGSFKIN